jgi:catechol 2,3-dioxygenase-like lactoylglutathione lyase family enzyme
MNPNHEERAMNNESAVQFETLRRIHMGLAVKDLERSVAFYRALLGHGPTKTRPGYAKFEVAEPPVNLALNEVTGIIGPLHPVAHFGIQVKSTEAVRQYAERLHQAGLETRSEHEVTCCYAVQNKVWSTDPDGNKWEVYVVLDNDAAHGSNACCKDTHGCADTVSACCSDPSNPCPEAENACCTEAASATCSDGANSCCAGTPDACGVESQPAGCEEQPSACCPDLPAIMEAVQRGDLAAAQAAFQKAGGLAACSCLTSDR